MPLEEVFRKKIEKLKEFNLVYEDNEMLSLTNRGRFFADEVCQEFFHPNYMPFPRSAYAHGRLYPYDDWEP